MNVVIADIVTGAFLTNPYGRFIFITVVFYILSKILQVVILNNIRRLTRKTKTNADDEIIGKLEKPLLRFLALIGLKIAVNVLPLSEGVMTVFHHIINSLLVIVVTLLGMKIVHLLLTSWGARWADKTESTLDDDLLPLLHKASNVVIILVGAFFVFGEWNIDVTGLLAGVGIAGLAFGFAIKDSLANVFGGISIILDKAIKVGDAVKLDSGLSGKILDIGLRSTKIRTWNNELLIIPNGNLANSVIQNYKKPDLSVRVVIPIGVEYGANIDNVKKVVKEALLSVDKVIKKSTKKPIQILFVNMADSALEFSVRFWVDDYTDKLKTKEEALCKIYKALNKHKIGIPFPTRTVYLHEEE